MKKIALFILLIFSSLSNIFAQTWPKAYTHGDYNSAGLSIMETYDGGLAILSQTFDGTHFLPGFILKTDVNGNILWRRDLLVGDTTTHVYNMITTSDTGFIISFRTIEEFPVPTNKFSYMKLNACGKVEWCRIFNNNDKAISSNKIYETPDGYVGMIKENVDHNFYFTLVKMDVNGNPEWMFDFDDANLNSETFGDVSILNDSSILVNGMACANGLPDNKPLRIHISKNGENKNFQLLYKYDSTISAADSQVIQSESGKLYSAGSTTIFSDPENYETFQSIRISDVYDSIPDFLTYIGNNLENYFIGITPADENVLAVTGFIFSMSNWSKSHWIYTMDTSGNLNNQRELLHNYEGLMLTMSTTADHKILLTGSCSDDNPWGLPGYCTLAFKLNLQLDDDSIYTSPKIYDFACTDGINPIDTLYLRGCDVIMHDGINDSFFNYTMLDVYPNPVNDAFQVRLPEFIAIRNSNKGLNTALYQSNYQQQSVLQVFDLNGRYITEQKLKQGQLIAEFDASNWAQGMFLLRLVYKDKTVGSAKVVK